MENEIITLEDLKKCVDWLYKNKINDDKDGYREGYMEGYMDALYDMAATLGNDEELADYHELVENN